MIRRRSNSKVNLDGYVGALQDANLSDRGLARWDHDQPLCLERPDEYVDYDYPLPSQEDAQALCEGCPMLALCDANARHMRPHWGIWGGEIWVKGRRTRLMEPDDPRITGNSQED